MKKDDQQTPPDASDDVVMTAPDDDATKPVADSTTAEAPVAAEVIDPVQFVGEEVMAALSIVHYNNGQPTEGAHRGVTRAIRRFGYLRQNLKYQTVQSLVLATLQSDCAPPRITTPTIRHKQQITTSRQQQQQITSSPSLVAALTTTTSLTLLSNLEANLKSCLTTLVSHQHTKSTTATPNDSCTATAGTAAGTAGTATGPGTAAEGAVEDQPMGGDGNDLSASKKPPVKLETLEVWINTVGYLSLLVLTKLLDCNLYSQAVELSDSILAYIEALPRKALDDNIAAKLFFFHSRSYELNGNFKDVRPTMLTAYRFAAMHHDSTKQAVALNCLLRNYIVYQHYQLAIKLVSKAMLPDDLRNNAQTARFLYYLGRLQAVQQDYSDAHASLTEAIGKAPVAAPPPVPLPTQSTTATGKSKDTTGTNKDENTTGKDKNTTGANKDENTTGKDKKNAGTDKKDAATDKKTAEKSKNRTGGLLEGSSREETTVGTLLEMSRPKSKTVVRARGFRLSAHKFSVVVELLMGGIPDRALFNQPDLRKDLLPYRRIVQAVRSGELTAFSKTMDDYRSLFERDGTLFLIVRLHRSVILAGVRTINSSYSFISLEDVARKLGLDTADEAEGVVSKAIAGSVIDAQIDHDSMTIRSKRVVDVYTSNEPTEELDKRIKFCIQLYNEALQAMQYPDETKAVEDTVQEASERRKEMHEQLARAEEDDDGGEGDLL